MTGISAQELVFSVGLQVDHYTVKKKNTFALGFGGNGLGFCLFVCVWLGVFHCTYVVRENNLEESVLFFHYVGPSNQTQVVRLGESTFTCRTFALVCPQWCLQGEVRKIFPVFPGTVKGKDQREAFLGILTGTFSSSIMIIAANFIVSDQETLSKEISLWWN